MTAGVYLIHFQPAYKHAKHYMGFAEDVDARLEAHRTGHGARLTQVAVEAGCELVLVRTRPGGDRTLERHLKKRKDAPKLCPICNWACGSQLLAALVVAGFVLVAGAIVEGALAQ